MRTKIDGLIQEFCLAYTASFEPDDGLLQKLLDKTRDIYALNTIYVLENMLSKFEYRFSYMSFLNTAADRRGTVVITDQERYHKRLSQFLASRITSEPIGTDSLYRPVPHEDLNYGMLVNNNIKWILGFTAEQGRLWQDEERAALTKLAAAINGFLSLKANALYASDVKQSYISTISKIFFASSIINFQTGEYEAIHIAPWQVPNFPPRGNFDALMSGLAKIVAPEYYEQYLNSCLTEPLYEYFARGNTAFEFSYRTRRDKGITWCRIVCYLYDKTEDGKPWHMFCMVEDISEQKQKDLESEQMLRQALEDVKQASKAKSDFLFNMSHDIRTPMNVILGFTDMAIEHQKSPELLGNYLSKIRVSSQQLLDILNNVLEMARIENNKIVLDEELCEVSSFWGRVFSLFEHEWNKKKFHIKIEEDVIHHYVYLDRVRMEQIFLNCMSNAVKYTPEGGSIIIGLREHPSNTEDECVFEYYIEDTGIGMSDEFQKHIFESFARERSSTLSGVQGTGLGLSIVKSMVELMHGKVEVFSKQGQGTKIVANIPHRIGKAPAQHTSQPCIAITNLAGKRVLLAEDNDLNAEIAEAILENLDLLVERAVDGVECLKLLAQAEPDYYDVVLMDIQMPNLDGYKTTQMIRSLDNQVKASIPVFAMTANAFKEDVEKSLSIGMNGHIAKPIDVHKLREALSGWFAEH